MSKKHRHSGFQTVGQSSGLSHAAEYKIIKMDLLRVLMLNVFYLALILFLYFGNQKSHFVDNWFAKILHF